MYRSIGRLSFLPLFIALLFLFSLTTMGLSARGITEVNEPAEESMDPASGPQRIVSISPALTEMLFALGAGERVAGVTTYCNYPAETAAKEKVGGFSIKSINLEKIIALRPDLVVGQASAHEPVKDDLDKLGVTVLLLPSGGMDQVLLNIAQLGDVLDSAPKAEAVIDDIKSRAATVTSRIESIPEDKRLKVFWEIWDEPLMTAGSATFTSDVLHRAGGINIFDDLEQEWPMVSHEEVVERDPDVIMASHTHQRKLSDEIVSSRPGWDEIAAVRNGRIHLLDGDIVSRPGPRVIDAMEGIAQALYPELFD
jgi:iron complex transport system substrate-binding protein